MSVSLGRPFSVECFAFLNSLGHEIFGGCHRRGKACLESCFAWIGKRKNEAEINYVFLISSSYQRLFKKKWRALFCGFCLLVHEYIVCRVYQGSVSELLLCWNRVGMCYMSLQVTSLPLLTVIFPTILTHIYRQSISEVVSGALSLWCLFVESSYCRCLCCKLDRRKLDTQGLGMHRYTHLLYLVPIHAPLVYNMFLYYLKYLNDSN